MARPSIWDRAARPLGDKGMSPHAICVHPMLTSRSGTRPVLGTSFCLGRSRGPEESGATGTPRAERQQETFLALPRSQLGSPRWGPVYCQ